MLLHLRIVEVIFLFRFSSYEIEKIWYTSANLVLGVMSDVTQTTASI